VAAVVFAVGYLAGRAALDRLHAVVNASVRSGDTISFSSSRGAVAARVLTVEDGWICAQEPGGVLWLIELAAAPDLAVERA
jgi:hypothetical protein